MPGERTLEGAFADLSGWPKTAVAGPGVIEWLERQLGVNLASLAPGRAVRGRLRLPGGDAREVTVAAPGGSLLIVEKPAPVPVVPVSVHRALAAAASAAGIDLEDRTAALGLLAFPGRHTPPSVPGTSASTPSCLAADGVDLFLLPEDRARILERLRSRFRLLTLAEALALV